jgi:drug/metabolite transporter (DMT)-like permease
MDTAALNEKKLSRLTRGYLICLSATFFWATTAVFIRYLTETYHLPALVLAFWRDSFVALGLGLTLAWTHLSSLRLELRHLKFILLYGLVLALFNSLWTFSVALNGAAVSTVLVYSSAAFTAILAWRLLAEPLGGLKILAVTLGMLGCVFVSGAYNPGVWRVNPFGILTGIISGLMFAAYSLMGKFSANRGIQPWTAMVYTFGTAAILLLATNLGLGWFGGVSDKANLFWLGNHFAGWGVLLVLGLGPTIGGFGLYTLSLTYLPASVANLIAMLEPALTAGLAYLVLGERLSGMQLFGSLLIISCVVIVRLSESRGMQTA